MVALLSIVYMVQQVNRNYEYASQIKKKVMMDFVQYFFSEYKTSKSWKWIFKFTKKINA